MIDRVIVRNTAIGLIAGFIGVLLAQMSVHVYTDHQAFHQIINLINANAAKQNGTAEHPAPQVPR